MIYNDFLVSSQTEDGAAAAHSKRQKPRHISVQGLRILLLHMADELPAILAWRYV